MGRKITRFAVAVLLAVLMSICGQLERYSLEVTATDRTIAGTDRHGQTVTLTECRADDDSRILLEDVAEGNRYRVTLDSCGTWSREDDGIIFVEIGSRDLERLADILSANGYYTERGTAE